MSARSHLCCPARKPHIETPGLSKGCRRTTKPQRWETAMVFQYLYNFALPLRQYGPTQNVQRNPSTSVATTRMRNLCWYTMPMSLMRLPRVSWEARPQRVESVWSSNWQKSILPFQDLLTVSGTMVCNWELTFYHKLNSLNIGIRCIELLTKNKSCRT